MRGWFRVQEKPKKLYYSISEVADLTGVKPHVLRYWEGEFSTLKPRKTRTGSRRYRQQDIEEIHCIKKLLYEEGFKIAGARKVRRQAHTKATHKPKEQLSLGFDQLDTQQQMQVIRTELEGLLDLVKGLKDGTSPKAQQAD